MKKLLSTITASLLCAALTACSPVPSYNSAADNSANESESGVIVKRSLESLKLSKEGGLSYVVNNVHTFEDLEHYSDLIVIGEFINNSSVCYRGVVDMNGIEFEHEVLSDCPMRITKVLSGDAQIGDVVYVLQEEHIDDEEGKFRTRSKLTPMQMGDEWLFCLELCKDERIDENHYWCAGDYKGRYPAKNSESNEVMCFSDYPELGVYDRSDFQEDFYNKLVEKYDI